MDHKSWPWKKKSSEKSAVASDDENIAGKGKEEEIQALLNDKADLERDLKVLNEELSSAISKCNSKDEVLKKQTKTAQEFLAGWEKSKAEVLSLKQELDEALRQKAAGDERVSNLDMALKQCMQQLRFVRDEQEQRIHDAVMKSTREFEKSRAILEDKLAEANKRFAKQGMENTCLNTALLTKEKLIEDMNLQKIRAEADINALMTRLESTEKENASLKYEVRVLEKELEIRNEEREFERRTADVAHKQHLESSKKIAKLESECQRLRVLVRKRLPGPAALAKMKDEVDLLGWDPTETRRRKSNPFPSASVDFGINNPLTPSKRMNLLEEENRFLKETLAKRENELQCSRIMYTRTSSRLSQVEAQLQEFPKVHASNEPIKNVPAPYELSLASMSDIGSDDKESWASALISELEHFKEGKHIGTPSRKTVGGSDIDLMDDFVEMERLTLVSMDKPPENPHVAVVGGSKLSSPSQIQSGGDSVIGPGVAVQSKNMLVGKYPGWLEDILKVILEQSRDTGRRPDEVLEDVKVALQYHNHTHHTNSGNFIDARESSNRANAAENSPISSQQKGNQKMQSNLSNTIGKLIELIEGIRNVSGSETLPGKDGSCFPYKNLETPSGYMVRVFQWKTSELAAILQQFIQTCNDFLTGKADVEKFGEELTSALGWVINHCFSLQDVSSMRDAIKKQFDWDEAQSESEVEIAAVSPEAEKLHIPKYQLSYTHIISPWGDPSVEDSKKLKDELEVMESAKKELEGRLESEIEKIESLTTQLRDSEKRMEGLQIEFQTVKDLNDVVENLKLLNEDLDAQLKVARVQLNEVRRELESKSKCCKELEDTCLDLRNQLESFATTKIPKEDADQEAKQLRTDLEIQAASDKLAECQDTILHLGKQLKAFASPGNAALLDKLPYNPASDISHTTSPKKIINQRSSLLDKMMAEDSSKTVNFQETYLRGSSKENETVGSSLAMVLSPVKKKEGLLKKLLWRRKKGNSKKLTLPLPLAA